jgi:DNA-binding transcriptional regulator YiaG
MNHPNRSRRKTPGHNPTPADVLALRERCEMTQAEFGGLIYASRNAVAQWESGQRRMAGALYEYACLLERSVEVRLAREAWVESWR